MSGPKTTTEHPAEAAFGHAGRARLSATGIVGLAALYFAVAWIVQTLVVPGLDFATFWPPVGVWIAAYLLSPTRRWPAITAVFAVAHVAFTVVARYRVEYTIGFLAVDVVDPLLGAALVRAAVRGHRVASPRALARMLAALAASSAASALGGTAVVALAEPTPIAETLVLWWAGDFLGAVLIVPAVVAGMPAPRRAQEGAAPEGAGLTLLAVLAATVVFRTGPDLPPLEFLLVPPFLWAALRFGVPAVSAVGAIDALIALATVRARTGPLIQAGYDAPIVSGYLQFLIGVELVAFQVLATAMLERRRALEEARAAEERFHAFLQHSPVPLFVKDAAGRLLATSESFLTRVDRPEEDVEGKHNADVFPPEVAAEVDESDARVLRENAPHRYVSVVRGRTYDTVKFPVPRPGDAPLIGGISQDVTEQRVAESTTRMAALGTLAAGVAHEINNPLSFVLANVSYATERLAGAPRVPPVVEAEEALREAREGAVRVRDIVRDMRSFARPHDAPARSEVDVRVPLRAALTMAQNELRHRARLVEELRDPPPVRANEHQLAQILLNLVVNAAQAIPEGRADANEVRVRTGATAEGEAYVEVQDTGRGMAEDERRRVFEPFFTTKPVGGGLGLGLFLSQNLVRALNGRIEVESALGRGSTFRVVLPAAVTPHARGANGVTAHEGERAAASPPNPAPMCVLVIDDEPLVGRSVDRMLRKEHRVEVLTDPRVALDRLAAGERFDAILCDLMMPQMSGMEFDARLAAVAPDARARTVFMTGGAFTPGAQSFLAGPGRRSLAKPFDAAALRRALAEVCGASGAERTAERSSEGS